MQEKWEEIKRFYIESNRIFAYSRLRLKERKRDFIPLLLSVVAMIVVSSALYFLHDPVWPMVVMFGTAISMFVFFRTIERKLSRVYAEEYRRYHIAKQGFLERFDYLAYALFADKVSHKGYTSEQLKLISSYSEALSPPPKPFLINQHFVTVILVSIIVSLFSAYIQKIPAWSTQALACLFGFIALAAIVTMGLDGLRASKMRDSRIRSYIKRAQIELEDRENLEKQMLNAQSSI